jgi:hypothetical protein
MKLIERNGLRILESEFGYLIHNKLNDSYSTKVYLGKFTSLDDFEEVEDNECDKKLKEKINSIDNENQNQNTLIDTTLIAIDEVYTISEAENMEQFELLDITLLAMDEIFILLEPLLDMSVMSLSSRKEVRNPMVELYVAMIQRGLKTIEEVPARYRKQVQELLDEIEK